MIINGWCHICLINNGYEIFLELHGRLLQSQLYYNSENIYISMVGDTGQQDRLIEYVFKRWPKYKVIFQSADVKHYEWPSLMHLRQHAQGSCYYIHTKGSSNECREDVPEHIQLNIRRWRDLMCYYVIGQWNLCNRIVEHGRGHDACGPLYDHNEKGKIFAGNFWWASERHIKRLPEVSGLNRNLAEEWVTSVDGNFYNMYAAPFKEDLYGFNSKERNPFGNYKQE